MKEFKVSDVSELGAIAREVIELSVEVMQSNHRSPTSVIALHGDLGAGKTTFMQTLAKELGVTEVVTSPTFVIMKKYDTEHESVKQLVHIDAYRIEDIDEMRPLRFKEELEQAETIIGIEWAEHISELLPEDTIHMYFEIEGEERVVKVTSQKEK